MSALTDDNGYFFEKQELPAPVSAPQQPPQGRSFIRHLARFALLFWIAFFVVDFLTEEPTTTKAYHGCMQRVHGHHRPHGHHGPHGVKGQDSHHHEHHGDHEHHGKHGHRFPDVDKWIPVDATKHFELEPAQVAGLTIKGAKSFGKVVFETSKLSDKVIFDFDVKTKKTDSEHQVTIIEENGLITISSPDTGKLKTYTSAKIQIPSNIIGTFGLQKFEVDAPKHMIDYSALPESLEIGELIIRVAKGFVKAGKVHTNTTQITVAKGAVRGSVTGARESTNIDVASGNVVVDVKSIAGGHEGSTLIHLGAGSLNGTFDVYNSTTLDVAKGSIFANVNFEESDERATLSTKVASGNARVYVDSIAEGRSFDASHLTVAGSQLITYPESFEGTIDARGLIGDIVLKGKDLSVERAFGGSIGKKGDENRASISVRAAKGSLDILVGDDSE